jgi:Txe/YoeB family toxin of Txe-Axe toxin-antitoxin module
MVRVKRSTRFKIHFRQRANKRVKALFFQRLKLFQKNPYDPALKLHSLKHKFEGCLSFRLTEDKGTDDFRVILEEVRGGYRFVDFGTHNQLYRPWQPAAQKK